MARSSIELRHEAERARIASYEATLRRVSRQSRPAPQFDKAIEEAKRGFASLIVRDDWAWRPKLKTRDPARLRLAAARYLFARYAVPEHLEQIWIDPAGLAPDEVRLRKRWYVVAAGGGSLFKAGAGEWLSRKEVHAFLTPLGRPSFDGALWQAIARSSTDDPAIAQRIACSRIAATPRAEIGRWREVVRFFCANPATVEEVNDLCDFLADCFRRDRAYSLKGRTLGSLRRQMRAWHDDLAAVARIEAARVRAEQAQGRKAIENGTWPGSPLADWHWATSHKDRAKREEFMAIQLKTAADLVAETRAMHHCVSSYAARCIAGNASIWSLRRRARGETQRLLTIELDRQNRAVQVRGYANRLARDDERSILERWATARSIIL